MFEALLPGGVIVVEALPEDWERAACAAEERAVHHAAARRRSEFRAGRACARRALERLGIRDFALLPSATRDPVWPDRVVGSITHTRGYCAAAVARCDSLAGLGIDAEIADPLPQDIVARVCTPLECRHLAGLPRLGTDWPKLVFCAKESFFKSYFPITRHFLEFGDVRVEIDAQRSSFTASLIDLSDPGVHGRRAFEGRYMEGNGLLASAVAIPADPRSPGAS